MTWNVKNTFNRMPNSNSISFVDCQLFLMDYSWIAQYSTCLESGRKLFTPGRFPFSHSCCNNDRISVSFMTKNALYNHPSY